MLVVWRHLRDPANSGVSHLPEFHFLGQAKLLTDTERLALHSKQIIKNQYAII